MVGGVSGQDETIKTFERMPIVGLSDSTLPWALIEPDTDVLSPRTDPIVCPISDTQLLIMGGYDNRSMLSDALVMDSLSLGV